MKNNQFSPFIQQISLRIFAEMRKLKTTELGRLSVEEFQSVEKWPICLVLDNVRSMNNVGSMFRTSDAFLVKTMFLCGITGCPPHREITKTAIGAEICSLGIPSIYPGSCEIIATTRLFCVCH